MRLDEIDTLTRHFLIAAMWSTTDESNPEGGDHFDENYGLEDLAPDAIKVAFEQCQEFQKVGADLLKLAYEFYDKNGNSAHPDAGSAEACAGHDFWLTKEGHGAGFWDRGMGKLGDELTKLAKQWGEGHMYLGDDGKIYLD